jgi:hypothetical protein
MAREELSTVLEVMLYRSWHSVNVVFQSEDTAFVHHTVNRGQVGKLVVNLTILKKVKLGRLPSAFAEYRWLIHFLQGLQLLHQPVNKIVLDVICVMIQEWELLPLRKNDAAYLLLNSWIFFHLVVKPD